MKTTPGPWDIYDETNEWPGIEAPSFSVIVFGTDDERDSGGVRGRTPEEAEANARLIATAPDLLTALKMTRQMLAQFCRPSEPYGAEVFRIADAAIAKAEGKS